MAGRMLAAGDVPTPGPWLVRGEAELGAPPVDLMLGVEPATDARPGGWPYLVRRDRAVEPGGCPLHVAVGIQRLADARLIAAAPDLAAVLLGLLIAPALRARDLDAQTRTAADAGWALIVRVAPQLEIGA